MLNSTNFKKTTFHFYIIEDIQSDYKWPDDFEGLYLLLRGREQKNLFTTKKSPNIQVFPIHGWVHNYSTSDNSMKNNMSRNTVYYKTIFQCQRWFRHGHQCSMWAPLVRQYIPPTGIFIIIHSQFWRTVINVCHNLQLSDIISGH